MKTNTTLRRSAALLLATVVLTLLGGVIGTATSSQCSDRLKIVDVSGPVSPGERPARFKAATWNVYWGTPTATLRPILDDLLERKVSLFFLQETQSPAVGRMLDRAGLRWHKAPDQLTVAWDPGRWQALGRERVWLTSRTYVNHGGHRVGAGAATVLLKDKRTGLVLDSASYHTPSQVQRPNADPARRAVLRGAMEGLATRAVNMLAHRANAVLYAGDDNVDERGSFGPWDFMLAPQTGLTQIRAPRPTHGHHVHGRRIDDFRKHGLRVGPGRVLPGGGDHRVHVRRFAWR